MNKLTEYVKDKKTSDLLIISDMDETLMHSDIYVSEENKKAIREWISMGGQFAVCSGRSIQTAEWMKVPTTIPSILYNGSAIYDFNTKEMLWAISIDDAYDEVSKNLMEQFPEMSICVYTAAGNYILHQNEWSEWLNSIEGCQPLAKNSVYKDIPGTIIKSCVMAPPKMIPAVLSYMDEKNEKNDPYYKHVAYAPSLPPLIEVTARGANKGIALQQLSQLTGIPLENVIYIGDNLNDLKAHAIAGFSIAPANGVEKVREVVDYITVSNNDHIMVDVLKQIKA